MSKSIRPSAVPSGSFGPPSRTPNGLGPDGLTGLGLTEKLAPGTSAPFSSRFLMWSSPHEVGVVMVPGSTQSFRVLVMEEPDDLERRLLA